MGGLESDYASDAKLQVPSAGWPAKFPNSSAATPASTKRESDIDDGDDDDEEIVSAVVSTEDQDGLSEKARAGEVKKEDLVKDGWTDCN